MMKKWKEYKLGDIGAFKNGVNFPAAKMGTGYPLVNVKDITNPGFLISEKLDRVDIKVSPEYYAKINDIFFVRSSVKREGVADVNIFKKLQEPSIHCGFVIRCRLDETKTNPLFLYYYFKDPNFREYIRGFSSGATITNISQGALKFVKISLPPLPTQGKIAKILSAYDELIENNLKRIKLLEEMAQITYEEWFVRMKFPGHETAVFDKETGLPEGWKKGQISEIIDFVSGFAFKSKDFQKTGNSVIKIKNIGSNTIDIFDTDCVSNKVEVPLKFQLKEGDLLIAMTGATIGKVGFIPKNDKTIFLNQRVGKFQKKSENDNIGFISCLFNSEVGIQQVMNFASGAAQPNISGNDILSIKSLIPKGEVLDSFSKIITPMFKITFNLHNQNQCLKEARDILLPRLMTGIIDLDKIETEL